MEEEERTGEEGEWEREEGMKDLTRSVSTSQSSSIWFFSEDESCRQT